WHTRFDCYWSSVVCLPIFLVGERQRSAPGLDHAATAGDYTCDCVTVSPVADEAGRAVQNDRMADRYAAVQKDQPAVYGVAHLKEEGVFRVAQASVRRDAECPVQQADVAGEAVGVGQVEPAVVRG